MIYGQAGFLTCNLAGLIISSWKLLPSVSFCFFLLPSVSLCLCLLPSDSICLFLECGAIIQKLKLTRAADIWPWGRHKQGQSDVISGLLERNLKPQNIDWMVCYNLIGKCNKCMIKKVYFWWLCVKAERQPSFIFIMKDGVEMVSVGVRHGKTCGENVLSIQRRRPSSHTFTLLELVESNIVFKYSCSGFTSSWR